MISWGFFSANNLNRCNLSEEDPLTCKALWILSLELRMAASKSNNKKKSLIKNDSKCQADTDSLPFILLFLSTDSFSVLPDTRSTCATFFHSPMHRNIHDLC